jgi:2-phosphoglycolate phosphatase
MMQAPRAVAFDLDGTLIDSGGDIVAAVNHALRENGKPSLPAATVLRFVGDGARVLCARAAGLGEKHPEVDELLRSYVDFYLQHPTDHTRWMPHARSVLDELRSYRLAIVTNEPRTTAEVVLARLGVRSLFSAVVADGDASANKPSPVPVLEAARRLGFEADQLVVVGDGPQDIESGRSAGARTIGVLGGFLPRERLVNSEPDILIATLQELPAILTRWSDPTVKAR